jgi:tetratricopeptide (TPR) repeat protein
LNPDNKDLFANARVDRALLYEERKRYKEAIDDYNTLIDILKIPYFLVDRGNVYLTIGIVNQAIKDFDRSINIGMRLADSYYYRGAAYSDEGDTTKAIADLSKTISILRPIKWKSDGLYEEKDGHKRSLILQYNHLPGSYYERGRLYQKLGNHKYAINDFNSALQQGYKLRAHLYCARGQSYVVSGRSKNAYNDFSKAVEAEPTYAEAYYQRAMIDKGVLKTKQASNDILIAARLGHKKAQDICVKLGIEW